MTVIFCQLTSLRYPHYDSDPVSGQKFAADHGIRLDTDELR